MKLKHSLVLLSALLANFGLHAQIKYIPPTAHAFSIGIGGGVTQLYSDFYGRPLEAAAWGDVNYNITPYLCAGIQVQQGTLEGGSLDITQKRNGFYINNSYTAATVNVRLSAGTFLMHAPPTTFVLIISGIYVGTGVGLLHNNIHTHYFGSIQSPPLRGPITTDSRVANIPANVGIDINMPMILGYTGLAVNLNYQYNFCQSDIVDGYDPQIPYNKHNDTYAFISAGLRFNFGRIR
jgi:hypothetical protein